MSKMTRAILRVAAFAGAALFAALLCLAPQSSSADAPVRGESFINFALSGGTWSDAEKSPLTSEDDLLCWAATAANILHYTGWGLVNGMTTSDEMFAYFVDHWTNLGGMMDFAWDWWFDGTNDSQGCSDWSQVDVAGGGFYPWQSFSDYYLDEWSTSLAMSAVAQYLRMGWGVGLALYGPGGHAVTCWGYTYDPAAPETCLGVWITDSDDDKYLLDPPDRLRYYSVAYSEVSEKWYLQDFYGSNNWYIGGVEALSVIPEPSSVLNLALCLIGFAVLRRKLPGRIA